MRQKLLKIDIELDVNFREISINKEIIKEAARLVLKEEMIDTADIGIIITDNEFLEGLNIEYFNRDYPTDVIAFNLGEAFESVEGEIYISVEQAKIHVREFQTDLKDELLRLIIHGILHLISYEDDTSENKKIMTTKENHYLELIER